jgi:hypothetical protein
MIECGSGVPPLFLKSRTNRIKSIGNRNHSREASWSAERSSAFTEKRRCLAALHDASRNSTASDNAPRLGERGAQAPLFFFQAITNPQRGKLTTP